MEQLNNSEILVKELTDLFSKIENIDDKNLKEAIFNLEKQKQKILTRRENLKNEEKTVKE